MVPGDPEAPRRAAAAAVMLAIRLLVFLSPRDNMGYMGERATREGESCRGTHSGELRGGRVGARGRGGFRAAELLL